MAVSPGNSILAGIRPVKLLQLFTALATLLLAGCFVEVEVDSSHGCVAIDGNTTCADALLQFVEGDSYRVTAIANEGYIFSHWKRGDKYLFGDNTEASLVLDVSGIEELPDDTFYLEPVFLPVCPADFSGDNFADYPYLNCRGDAMSTDYAFADVAGGSRIYEVSVLFYVDTQRPELARSTLEDFVDRQLDIQNRAVADSGVRLKYTVAGIIPITIPATGKSLTDKVLDDMVAGEGNFSRIAQDRERFDADLVHAIIKSGDGQNTCGVAYIDVINLPDKYHVGVTACFDAEGASTRYSLAHELGHNLGLVHDVNNASDAGIGAFSFGRGWSLEPGFITVGSIMSYASQAELFSSPNNTITDRFTGETYVMGDSVTDAVRALNLVRLDYSRIRPVIPGRSGVSARSLTGQGPLSRVPRVPRRSVGCEPGHR